MTEEPRLSPESLRAFIRENLPLVALPSLPDIRLHRAHPASRLRRLSEHDPEAFGSPYWAYPWPGGVALASHVLARPETVAGKRVLDFGAGSGVVAIAAAKAGAQQVLAAEIDRHAIVALAMNAAANDVTIEIVTDDLTRAPPPAVDLVLVGDLFYEQRLAHRVTRFLAACRKKETAVLVGDVGRAHLPRARLTRLADYPVTEFGRSETGARTVCSVYAFDG